MFLILLLICLALLLLR
ncbi:hypothetical protein, partial [Stenotrophomonas maltophilia group sp. CASM26]